MKVQTAYIKVRKMNRRTLQKNSKILLLHRNRARIVHLQGSRRLDKALKKFIQLKEAQMVVIFLDDARPEDHGSSYCLTDRNEP
jgi:hypothetical protein